LPTPADKELRRLADAAYRIELSDELMRLETDFQRWRAGELSPFDIVERIHAFHEGAARDLWKTYSFGKPRIAVARAIARGLISESEVSPELLSDLGNAIDFYRQDLTETDASMNDER
jgi:hypothetical protein